MGDPTERKSKFENVSPGVLGVVQFDMEGKPKGVPVPYKGIVFLSEEEQILTANAPRNESDNPFLNGLKLLARGAEMERARPIGEDQADAGPESAPAPEAEDPAPEHLSGDPVGDTPAAPEDRAQGTEPPGEIRTERAAPPPPPAPASPSGATGGAEVVKPAPAAPATDERQVKSAMRPSTSPAAVPTPPPPAEAEPAAAD